MKIPDSFTLGAVTWETRIVDELSGDLGLCNHETGIINLKKNTNTSILEATYCHELFHAFLYSTGRMEDHDEIMVEGVGRVMHQYFTKYHK